MKTLLEEHRKITQSRRYTRIFSDAHFTSLFVFDRKKSMLMPLFVIVTFYPNICFVYVGPLLRVFGL